MGREPALHSERGTYEPSQEPRARDCRRDGRDAELEDRRPVGSLAQQRAFEKIVEQVNYASGSDCHGRGEEQRESGEQERAKPEPRVKR